MGIAAGGQRIPVDLPMERLSRFQLQDGEKWPEGTVYRVKTTHGDDFFVDADTTKIVLENELGMFAPFLSECASVRPLADNEGDWRVVLETGTVLIGPLTGGGIEFALAMGPEEATVPLDLLVSMDRQEWETDAQEKQYARWAGLSVPEQFAEMSVPEPAPAIAIAPVDTGTLAAAPAGAGSASPAIPTEVENQRATRRPPPSPAGWFRRDAIADYKSSH
jgi:hypothetical protein